MVFSSLYFTFFFFPLIVILYYLSKEKYRNYILLVASIYFYAYGEPIFVFVMIGSILINYVIALGISRVSNNENLLFAKALLIVDIIVNIGILFVFKYLDFSLSVSNYFFGTNFMIKNIPLPIGISFFTFQALSYVIDVYRKKVQVQKNLFYLALYISFFPQLIAGPIVRYSSIAQQITQRQYSLDKFADGLRRFLLGFCKKVILANNLSVVAGEIFDLDIPTANPMVLWLGSICFSLQIFYDFSGYSDMAIGLGKIFGFEFEENFNYPYISKSITEFWRRWHISLGQWFRDYVYIPLGGSRASVPKHLINMFVVWTLTGIWHGANYTFIAWGIGYFILLVIEKYIIRPEKRKNIVIRVTWQMITLICVNFGWVIFNSSSIKNGIKYCLSMIGYYGQTFLLDSSITRYGREFGIYIFLGVLFATPIMKALREKVNNSKYGNIIGIIEPVCYGVLFLWATSFIILGAHNPFIYFNF